LRLAHTRRQQDTRLRNDENRKFHHRKTLKNV
jgi:hypothetical protein